MIFLFDIAEPILISEMITRIVCRGVTFELLYLVSGFHNKSGRRYANFGHGDTPYNIDHLLNCSKKKKN